MTDHARPTAQPVPTLTKLGVVVMVVGFLFDLVEHGLVNHAGELRLVGIPVSQHAAHFVVIVGMVLVLGGIVAQGRRLSHRKHQHNLRRDLDAVR